MTRATGKTADEHATVDRDPGIAGRRARARSVNGRGLLYSRRTAPGYIGPRTARHRAGPGAGSRPAADTSRSAFLPAGRAR